MTFSEYFTKMYLKSMALRRGGVVITKTKNLPVLAGIFSGLLSVGYGIIMDAEYSVNIHSSVSAHAASSVGVPNSAVFLALSGILICGGLTATSYFICKLAENNRQSEKKDIKHTVSPVLSQKSRCVTCKGKKRCGKRRCTTARKSCANSHK